jgi:hypothetical protein
MSFLRSRLLQAFLVLAIAFVIFRFGIRPPVPYSVLSLYMGIVLLAVLAFVSSDSDSWRAFLRPMRATVVDPDKRVLRLALMIVIPLLLGYYAYTQAAAKPQAPAELRAVHPAPPDSIQLAARSTSGTACTATAITLTGKGTSRTASTRRPRTSRTPAPSRCSRRRTCSGESRRAAPGFRRKRRRGTPSCPPGKTG